MCNSSLGEVACLYLTVKAKCLSRSICLFIFRVREEKKQFGANIFNTAKLKSHEFLTHSKDEGHTAPINGVRKIWDVIQNYYTKTITTNSTYSFTVRYL